MVRNEIQAAVAETVLLAKIAHEAVAPFVRARRLGTDGEPVAGMPQPITEVVVVTITKGFVEQAHVSERAGTICRVPGADVIDVASILNLAVSLPQVEAHHPRPD